MLPPCGGCFSAFSGDDPLLGFSPSLPASPSCREIMLCRLYLSRFVSGCTTDPALYGDMVAKFIADDHAHLFQMIKHGAI